MVGQVRFCPLRSIISTDSKDSLGPPPTVINLVQDPGLELLENLEYIIEVIHLEIPTDLD